MKKRLANQAKTFGVWLVIYLAFSNLCPAQKGQSDLEAHGLKGRVKTVEEYNVFYSPEGQIFKKILSSLNNFDSKGRLTESIQIVDQGENSFYHKYKYGFDRKGRKKIDEIYVSSKGRLQDIFLPDIAETNIRKPNPQFTEKLIFRAEYEFNRKGNVKKETIIDAVADITSKSVHIYNDKGDVRIFTSKNNGQPFLELAGVYNENKTRLENVNYENSLPVHKTISYYDANKNFLYSEQFKLKPPPNNDGFIKTPAFRRTETKSGEIRTTENLSFDERGFLTFKSVHLFKNELPISQVVYKYSNTDNSEKFIHYQTKTAYEFDKTGSWVKSTVFKQEGENPNFVKNFSVVRIISYY